MYVYNMKIIQQTVSGISRENKTYPLPLTKVNNGHKTMLKYLVKGYTPQKAYLHPMRDVCVQYENNTADGFLYIVRKRNTDARPSMLLTISFISLHGGKKRYTFCLRWGGGGQGHCFKLMIILHI